MDQRNTLLKHLHRKEEKAYELLYRYYYVPLVLFAGKYVSDEEVAKDIVQEFFIAMLNQDLRFENTTALKVYLYNGVKNKAINYLRHQKIRDRYEIKVLEEQEEIELFWDRVMEEDIFARILTVVEKLPHQCSRVMLLTLKGYKISEIAEIMGISLETAKEYKKSGKKRLTEQLTGGVYSLVIGILFS